MTPASQRPFVSDSGTNPSSAWSSDTTGWAGWCKPCSRLTHISIFGDPIDLTLSRHVVGIGNRVRSDLSSALAAGKLVLLRRWSGSGAFRLRKPKLPLDRRGSPGGLGRMVLVAALFFSTARFSTSTPGDDRAGRGTGRHRVVTCGENTGNE